jgi:hypothetical protein
MNLRSPGAAKAIGSGGLLLIAGLGWGAVVGPSTGTLSDLREEVASTSAQNRVLEARLGGLQRQALDLSATRRTARALAVRFPPTADQPGMFLQVTTAASKAGIRPGEVTALTPTAPTFGTQEAAASGATGAEDLARQTVTVGVEGSYLATQKLLGNLEEMPRAYLISSVNIASGTERSFTTTVTGEMFVLVPAVEADPTQKATTP